MDLEIWKSLRIWSQNKSFGDNIFSKEIMEIFRGKYSKGIVLWQNLMRESQYRFIGDHFSTMRIWQKILCLRLWCLKKIIASSLWGSVTSIKNPLTSHKCSTSFLEPHLSYASIWALWTRLHWPFCASEEEIYKMHYCGNSLIYKVGRGTSSLKHTMAITINILLESMCWKFCCLIQITSNRTTHFTTNLIKDLMKVINVIHQ
jgi:hypothetical protein